MSEAVDLNQVKPESPEALRRRLAEMGGDADDAYQFGAPPEELPAFDPPAPTRVTDTESVVIETVDLADKRQRAQFVDMAASIYDGDPNYIAPLRMHLMKFLDPTKNPAFENLEVRAIVAKQNGRIVGRMTMQLDRAYDVYHETKAGFFGFFESINDKKVAHGMLNSATKWMIDRGVKEVFGPMNFTTNHQAGLLVENFDRPPFVEENYNPSYYEELFTSYGFGKAKDLLVWWIDVTGGMETKNRKRIARISDRIKKREGVEFRHIDLNDADNEIDRMFDLYVQAWQKNWGFVPLTKKEFTWLAQDLKEVAIPELVMFVEQDGKPVGFCATLPNVNEVLPKNGRLFPFAWLKLIGGRIKKTRTGRLYTLGMLPEYRKRGLEAMMFAETVVRAQAVGIEEGEIGWTLEDNTLINRAIESMDGFIDRRYRILGLALNVDA